MGKEMRPDAFWIHAPLIGRLAMMHRPRAGEWLDDDQYAGRNTAATNSFQRRALDRADAKKGIGCANNRESEHGFEFHLKTDSYRRLQRGPLMDINLARGLHSRRVS